MGAPRSSFLGGDDLLVISRTGGYALADHFVEIVELNFFLCCTLSSVRVIFSKKQGNTNETQQEKQKNNF